jgi:hypothetical protein
VSDASCDCRPSLPRSSLFRALGRDDPPEEVVIGGDIYRRHTIFKHDSWAATALYEGPAGKVVCKFNRQQSILGLPMRWLGRVLARHETHVLARLRDLPHVPQLIGPVFASGARLDHVAAHLYVEGHPLAKNERVAPGFFDRLASALRTLHDRGMAYVDLHKRENILVRDDGEPCLCDFQISFVLSRRWTGIFSGLLSILQRADWYHLEKHRRSSLSNGEGPRVAPPWFIRVHRVIGKRFRTWRRGLLVALGMRHGAGRADTEHFAEDAVRRDIEARRRAA